MENEIKIEEYEEILCCPKCGFRKIRVIYAIGKPSYLYCLVCNDWIYELTLLKRNFDINHQEPDFQNLVHRYSLIGAEERELKRFAEEKNAKEFGEDTKNAQ